MRPGRELVLKEEAEQFTLGLDRGCHFYGVEDEGFLLLSIKGVLGAATSFFL